MGTYLCLSVPTVVCGCLLMSERANGCLCACLLEPVGTYWCLRMPTGVRGCLLLSVGAF